MSEQLEQRLRQLEATLLINPRDPWTHSRRGHVLLQLGRLDDALASFTKVSALDPKLPEGPQGVGEVEYAQGKTAAAHESFKKALALNGLHVPTLASLIRFHEGRSEYQQAEAYYKKILESPKADDPEWIRRAAFNWYRQKKFVQALPVLAQAHEKLPKDDEVTIALGVSAANDGQLIQARTLLEPFSERSALAPADDAVLADVLLALEDWSRAARVWLPLKNHPDLVQRARLGLGRCHEEMALHRDAIEELTPIADSALSADITWLLARAFLGIADAAQALRYAELGLSRYTTDARLHYFAGKALMNLGRVQDAVTALERAVRYAPGAIEPLELLAEGHIRLERYDAASHDFTRLVEIAPRDPRLHLERAQFERAHGTLQRAEQCFGRAFEVDSGSSLAALGAAQCANDLSNPTAARHWVDKALELEPTLVSALQLSGTLHLQSGKPREALAHLIQASTLAPTDAGILRTMAACYRQLEQAENEAELLERSLQIGFEQASAKRLGHVSLGLKRYERAVELLTRVVEQSPRDAEAQADLGLGHECLRDLPKARVALAAACDVDRSHAGNHFALGRLCLLLDDPAAAVTALEHAMRLGDNRAEVSMKLGDAYQKLGLLREASQEYRKITTLTPSDVPASFALGSVLAELGEHVDAVHHLERVVEQEPSHGAAWLRLGAERLTMNQPDQAVECFRKASSLLPDSSQAFQGLALAASRIQQHDEAVRATRHWLRLEPDHLEALALLAESLEALNRLEEARETWIQRLRVEPNNASDSELRLGMLLMKLFRFDTAAEHLARALARSNSRQVEHWELLADCYERLGAKDALLSTLATVCEIDPRSGARWRRLGLVEYAAGHEPKAIVALEKAWNASATDQETQDLLTKMFRARAEREVLAEQLDAALGSYRKAVEYQPNDAQLYASMGSLLVRMALKEEALPVFERASVLDSKNVAIQLQLARLLRGIGEAERALGAYSKVLKLQPENREALAGLAELQRSLGDPAEALAALQQLVRLEPNQPEYRLELGSLLVEEKRPNDAIAHLALAADALPLDPKAQYLLGHCHAELGQDAQAVPAFERALTQAKQLDWCRELVTSLQRLGKTSDVVAAFSPFRHLSGWTSLDAAELGLALAKLERDGEAIEVLREAIVENPSDALHDALLLALWRTKAYDDIVQCGEAILSTNPTHRKALELAANALLALGRDDARATSLLERLLALDPANTAAKQQVVKLRSKRAVAALDQSSEDAIRELQRALELSPSDPQLLYQLGACYARAERAQLALDHALKCLSVDEQHQAAWVLRGELEAAAGRHVAARSSFERAVSIDPTDPAAHRGLASVLEALSEAALASEHYRALCELQPNVVEWRERLIRLASRPGEERAAIEHLSALSAMRSLTLEERRRLAFLEAGHGSHDHAVAHLSQVLESTPSDKDCMAQLAASLAAVGRESDGIPWLERLVRLESTYPNAQARLGISLSNADRHDAALVHLESALTRNAEDLDVRKALVRTYAALGKKQQQLDVLLSVAKAEPDVAEHFEAIGQLYLELGRESDAIEPWTAAVTLADNPKLREQLYELLMEHADQALEDTELPTAQQLLIRAKDQAQNSAPRLLACARRLRDAGDREHATEIALQSRSLADNLAINLLLGELWLDRERPLEASQCFEHALALRVDSVDALTGLGRAQIAAAAYADAEATLQQAAHLAPGDARPVELLVDLYVRTSRLDRAVAMQTNAVALRKSSVEALVRLGDLEMLAGNPRRAVEPFENAYRQAPNNERVRGALASCYWQLERWQDLLVLADAALAESPDAMEWREWRGKALGRLDRLSDAIAELERVKLLRPNDTQLQQLLADLYARTGQSVVADPRQAAAALQQAMAHGDNRVVTRRELARALRATGELHDAVRWAESCVRDEPTQEHWILLGELDAMLGRYDRAVQAFESAVTADSRSAQGWIGLGLAYEQLGRFETAAEALNSAIRIVPTILAFESLARIQMRQKRWQNALDALTQLHRLRAPQASELQQTAMLLRHLDRPEEALSAYARSIELEPENVESLLALGALRIELGKPEAALDSLEAAQRVSPQHPGIDEQLAIAYGRTGRHEQALSCAKRQLSREKSEALLRVVADAEEALGRHQEAAAALAEIASIGGDSAQALFELGIAQAKGGSTDRAIQSLSRARELSGGALGTSELCELLITATEDQIGQGNRE
ncbi:MAG: tetratricopeptide repeat protein, partial [Myxococcales bacterium]